MLSWSAMNLFILLWLVDEPIDGQKLNDDITVLGATI